MNLRNPLLGAALLLSPALAFAHPGHEHSGLVAGLAHPLFGLDHLLAMLASASGPPSSRAARAGPCR